MNGCLARGNAQAWLTPSIECPFRTRDLSRRGDVTIIVDADEYGNTEIPTEGWSASFARTEVETNPDGVHKGYHVLRMPSITGEAAYMCPFLGCC